MRLGRDFDPLILITAILLILIGLSLIYSVFQPSQTAAIESTRARRSISTSQ